MKKGVSLQNRAMWCSEFLVRNFRNIFPCRVQWSAGLNLLTGRNGAGKTNCLEGLHLLTGWGPFGARKDLVSWEGREKQAFLTGTFCGEEDLFVATSIGGNTLIKCDGKRTSFPEIRAKVPALGFLPRDMALLDGSPSGRRHFLDRLCALLFPLYARKLSDYRRVVRHRTILLRSGKSTFSISKVMAPLAAWIWSSREEAIHLLSLGLTDFSDLLPGSLKLEYIRGGGGRKENPLEDWWDSLESRKEKERLCFVSLVGPHRDDLVVQIGVREAASYLSRGQIRRASVALMLAAGKAVEAKLRRKPLILLDEIASELDKEGREVTVVSLKNTGWQVVAAATEPVVDFWPGTLWKIEEGTIFPLSQ